ncbi:hypothetical protein ABZ079_15350 [Streptomyces sp. NPDC006314]|uniref:hypothetical protein n=1 Tax=Streptomyces sp. NPDC006314 TaxID=3154475 RepID=UPI0033B17DAD
MRLVFVHGTGVREKRFTRLSGLVSDKLRSRLPSAEVHAVCWGEAHGASLSAGGASIPRGGRVVRGPADGTPLDEEAAGWGLLLADPLCELRVLAECAPADDGVGTPGVRAAGRQVADALEELPAALAADRDLTGPVRAVGGMPNLLTSAETVASASEFADACDAAAYAPAVRELGYATARAVIACALAVAGDEALCTGDERDSLVDLLCVRLGGAGRFPGGRVGAVLGTLALRLTTQPLLDRWRTSLTTGAVPALGDILRYQARGRPLRDHLEKVIVSHDGPTVVIGHSLGGVALVDMCALAAIRQTGPPQPLLLVTVGSQAPFLHELGALTGLPPSAGLPPGFPRWLNVYDRTDLLAYRAQPVFPGDPRVTDQEVSSRQPFPLSHSAYWKLDAVYDRIVKEIEAPQ